MLHRTRCGTLKQTITSEVEFARVYTRFYQAVHMWDLCNEKLVHTVSRTSTLKQTAMCKESLGHLKGSPPGWCASIHFSVWQTSSGSWSHSPSAPDRCRSGFAHPRSYSLLVLYCFLGIYRGH